MESKFKGPAFYKEDDQKIFFGRDKESEKLFELVQHSDFSVCYAMSGEGKSSLINAGLCPLLKQNNFFPIRVEGLVSVNNIDNTTFDSFIWRKILEAVEAAQKKKEYQGLILHTKSIPLYSSEEQETKGMLVSETLWWKLRNYELRKNNYEVLTPVLIFDQFEEIFSLKDTNWTFSFFEWLERLYQDDTYESGKRKRFKALFSLRSEYVCELDYWSMTPFFIPSLKNNRFCLKPLTKESALLVASQLKQIPTSLTIEDIIRYAKSDRTVEWQDIRENLPCVSALILSLILTGLSERDSVFETKINEQCQGGGNIKGKELLDFLLNHIYENALNKCNIDNRQVKVFIETLEDKLIDSNGKRKHPTEKELLDINDPIASKTLKVIMDERIVNSVGGHYEISHDTLCNVIYNRREKRHAALQREHATIKANYKKELIIKKYKNDYFVLFPLFLFACLSIYFLFNAMMNEVVLWFSDTYLEQELNLYAHMKSPFLKSKEVHLLGNAFMILLLFMVINNLILYFNRKRGFSFKIYSFIVFGVSLSLCYWHFSYYIPYHEIFKYFSPLYEKLGWYFIYGGLIGLPLFLLFFSLINNEKKNNLSWTDVLLMKPVFSSVQARWYMIIILFICLYLCNNTIYTRRVSDGESIIFVLLIGVLVHSIFEKNTRLSDRLLSYVPVFIFCLGLWFIEGEYIWTQKFIDLFRVNIGIYYLIIFIVFFFLEIYVCIHYVNLRKNSLLTVLVTIIPIISISAILYIGILPWNTSQLVFPKINTTMKWNYYISKDNHRDTLYGANLYNGNNLLPYVFESQDSMKLFFRVDPNNLYQSIGDSIFLNQAQILKTHTLGLSNDSNKINCIVNSKVFYMFFQNVEFVEGDSQKYLASLAFNTYQEILNVLYRRLKNGIDMSSSNIVHADILKRTLHNRADSLYNEISSNSDTKSYIDSDKLLLYFETVVREFSIATMMEMLKKNNLFFVIYSLNSYEYSFFYRVMNKERWHSSLNLDYKYNNFIELGKEKNDLSFKMETRIDLDNISRLDIFSWQNLWKSIYTYYRAYAQTLWSYEYKRTIESVQINNMEVKERLQEMKSQILNVYISSLLSTSDKEKKQTIKSAKDLMKEIKDMKSKLKESTEISDSIWTLNGEISELCKDRMEQIKKITDKTDKTGKTYESFESFGREVYMEMMVLRMLSGYNVESLRKDMDSLQKTYEEVKQEYLNKIEKIFDLQNGLYEFKSTLNKYNSELQKIHTQ